MKFCEKCNNIMKPIDDIENRFECISCGSIEVIRGDEMIASEKIAKKPEIKQGVVDGKNIFATFDEGFVCSKCGYDKAEVIEKQPYVSDEDSLTFLRCGRCGYTSQLARKIG